MNSSATKKNHLEKRVCQISYFNYKFGNADWVVQLILSAHSFQLNKFEHKITIWNPTAEEVPDRQIKILNPGGDDDITKVKKPKRVLLKLDLDKLFSDRGLSAIPNHIKPLKFRGKGHELEDITNICKAYEHWAHRLYPKMTFKDVIEKVHHSIASLKLKINNRFAW